VNFSSLNILLYVFSPFISESNSISNSEPLSIFEVSIVISSNERNNASNGSSFSLLSFEVVYENSSSSSIPKFISDTANTDFVLLFIIVPDAIAVPVDNTINFLLHIINMLLNVIYLINIL